MITRAHQPAFTSGALSPALCARIDLQKYDSGAKVLENIIVRPEGGATKAPGTRFIADTGAAAKVRLIPFIFSTSQSYVLEFSDKRIRVITENGVVVDSSSAPVSIATPYAAAHLFGISYTQSADVMYLAHRGYAPMKLMRYGHDDWRLEAVSFAPKTPAPQSARATFSVEEKTGRTWRYVVTAIDRDTGEESLPSNVASVVGSESMRVGVMMDGEPVEDWYANISWSTVSNANEYRVYKETAEGSGFYGFVGSAVNAKFADRNISPNAEDSPPVANNPFARGKNPGCVAIHQQRLAFASTTSKPNTIWLSRTGSFENFTKSMRVKDDDYIEATIASGKMNRIVWIKSLRELVIGTSGDEWELRGESNVLTPGGINARQQSARGSAENLEPIVADNLILHAGRTGANVYDLQYNYTADSYRGTDRSLFSSHYFYGRRIVDMDYQSDPGSTAWFVMSDGALLGFTWLPEQEVFPWHKHTTDGAYESVCVIPGEKQDNVFFVVRRKVNGKTVRYVEIQTPRFEVSEGYESMSNEQQKNILAGAFFVHSGLSYSGTPVKAVSGLGHLEGKKVAILADGAVKPSQVVKNGRVSLEREASIIHIGLPYASKLETVNFEPTMQNGVSVGKKKRIAKVSVKFENSCGVLVGMNGQMTEVKWRTTEQFGLPPRLRSETYEVVIPGGWNRESSISIESQSPLPFTVLSITPEVELEY
ncbi:hypothetical protein LJC46_04350 [Desulfovibrio sp. OttesenSCG-928-G15]|nr:hypothetical protein [Desulfovibrio sp. OttesenSCG-928-G15]